jgi:hypothetical protein
MGRVFLTDTHVCLHLYKGTFTSLTTFSRIKDLAGKALRGVRYPFMGPWVEGCGVLGLWIWEIG